LETVLRTSSNITVIGSVSDWSRTESSDPDVIVADWDRPGEDLPHELLELAPTAALVLLADDPQAAFTADALRSGARAVLARDASPAQILTAVEAVATGLIVLQAEDVDSVLATPRPARAHESLSPREIEVLGMLAEGASNKAIAHRLRISEHTVKFHVNSIMTKLNAGSRTEAVTLGIRQGLIML
jgi:DNA-binding NarL/FixJ family response regulator